MARHAGPSEQPEYLGPGDDGATQAFQPPQPQQQAYTSQQANSIYQEQTRRVEQPVEQTQSLPPVQHPPVNQGRIQQAYVTPNYNHNDPYNGGYNDPYGQDPFAPQPDDDEDDDKNSNTKLIVSIVVVLLLILGLGGVIVWQSLGAGSDEQQVEETVVDEETPTEEPSQTQTVEEKPTQTQEETVTQEPQPTVTKTVTQPAQPTETNPPKTADQPANPEPAQPDNNQ